MWKWWEYRPEGGKQQKIYLNLYKILEAIFHSFEYLFYSEGVTCCSNQKTIFIFYLHMYVNEKLGLLHHVAIFLEPFRQRVRWLQVLIYLSNINCGFLAVTSDIHLQSSSSYKFS